MLCPCVRPFVRLLPVSLVTTTFCNECAASAANCHKWSTRQGYEINSWDQEVKGQKVTQSKPKLELQSWRRHRFRPRRSSRFSTSLVKLSLIRTASG